jgi:hypothetical protein
MGSPRVGSNPTGVISEIGRASEQWGEGKDQINKLWGARGVPDLHQMRVNRLANLGCPWGARPSPDEGK